MNKFMDNLERKFGRYAISDLIKYMVAIYCAGASIGMAQTLGIIDSTFYYDYLALNMDKVFHGQVWRLFSYLLEPYGFSSGGGIILDILFFLIKVNLFFMFGKSLEQIWGTFRFNLYILAGFLLNIIAALILYLSPLHFEIYAAGFEYIYWAMFFAFAVENPDIQFLLYFIIPVKVKWLAILDAVFLGYSVFQNIRVGFLYLNAGYVLNSQIYFSAALAIIVAMGNFLIFFFATRNYSRISPAQRRRKKKYTRGTTSSAQYAGGARHKCAICGRTEIDAPELEFRYCSKCDGNYEYCSEHLFTHVHVKK